MTLTLQYLTMHHNGLTQAYDFTYVQFAQAEFLQNNIKFFYNTNSNPDFIIPLLSKIKIYSEWLIQTKHTLINAHEQLSNGNRAIYDWTRDGVFDPKITRFVCVWLKVYTLNLAEIREHINSNFITDYMIHFKYYLIDYNVYSSNIPDDHEIWSNVFGAGWDAPNCEVVRQDFRLAVDPIFEAKIVNSRVLSSLIDQGILDVFRI